MIRRNTVFRVLSADAQERGSHPLVLNCGSAAPCGADADYLQTKTVKPETGKMDAIPPYAVYEITAP